MLSHFSHVQLLATLWTVALRAPLYMGFFRQEYWSGLPFLLPGDLPDPGMEPMFPVSATMTGGFFTSRHQRSPPFYLQPNKKQREVCFHNNTL